ncbi:helix-turn-helix domain-containing protein [Aquimarina rhabdastrellae]
MDLIIPHILKILDGDNQVNHYHFQPNDLIMTQKSDFFMDNLVIFINGIAEAFCEYEKANHFLFFIETAQVHFLNSINVATQTPLEFSLKAITSCDAIFIPKEKFLHTKDNFDTLYPYLAQDQYTTQRLITNSIIHTITKNLDELLYIYLKQKATVLKIQELHIQRNELSDSLNFSRESISRSLKRLEQQKRILRKPRSIIITGF